MKKGYWVVAYRSISDESALKAYGALALPAVESFGGHFLTRSTSQIRPTKPDYSCGRYLSNSTATISPSQPMKARLTKRRYRHLVPARNATTASLKVRRTRRNQTFLVNLWDGPPQQSFGIRAAAIQHN